MDEQLRTEILKRLKADFFSKGKTGGERWSGGKCPKCPGNGGKELYVYTANPWTVVCGRENRCGARISVKELYSDLFDNWSDRHQQTPEDPHAAARAYLRDGRRLDLSKLAGIYTQEVFQDWETKLTSATVRFQMSYGTDSKTAEKRAGYWERIIDRPQRFGKKKANMPTGWRFGGHVWHHPESSIDQLAMQEEIWFAEGIFDACALNQAFDQVRPNARSVSTLSTNNYPKHFFTMLAEACKRLGQPRPVLVWAFDVGPAGVRWTREYVTQSRLEGWTAKAAQVTPDGEGNKADWNDLLGLDRLTDETLKTYLENGEITIATSAADKAFLLWLRHGSADFSLVFGGKTYWARLSSADVNQLITEWAEQNINQDMEPEMRVKEAARACLKIEDIANCVFNALYYERREQDISGSYYFRITFPGKTPQARANFAPAAVAKAPAFKEALLGVAAGAMFTGSNFQLEKMMKRQLNEIRTVIGIDFRGYSIQHNAWLFDKVAVAGGRIVEINDQDFFEIGQIGVKLPRAANADSSTDRFDIETSLPEGKNPWFWWRDLHTAFGPLGTVALAYWFLSLFSEQIRRDWQDLGFLEITGEPGSGKSTMLIFFWKLVGRLGNYEGFDPAKTTVAGLSRELVKVGNLPVVLIEGDRASDQPQQRRFDWDELKPLYNGNPPRTRGVANGGTETYAPRFRGAIIIAQNHAITAVDADRAVLERIVGMKVDKSRFSEDGLAAGERLKTLEVSDLSHWIVTMVRQEKAIIGAFNDRFPKHFKRLRDHEHVSVDRLARTHAQVATALDCLVAAMKHEGKPVISPDQAAAAHKLIDEMCVQRHGVLDADHPIVALFWENFDFLDQKILEGWTSKFSDDRAFGLNFHRKPNQMVAVHLPTFEAKSAFYRIALPAPLTELKKLLVHSKSRKFIKAGPTNCIDSRPGDEKTRHCWLFQRPVTEVAAMEASYV